MGAHHTSYHGTVFYVQQSYRCLLDGGITTLLNDRSGNINTALLCESHR